MRRRKEIGRGERIRTSGPCLPKTVLYQAELLPDRSLRQPGPTRRQGGPLDAPFGNFKRQSAVAARLAFLHQLRLPKAEVSIVDEDQMIEKFDVEQTQEPGRFACATDIGVAG